MASSLSLRARWAGLTGSFQRISSRQHEQNERRRRLLAAAVRSVVEPLERRQMLSGAPVAPAGLTATLAGRDVTLAWQDRSSDEVGFRVERSADGVSWAELDTTAPNTTSYRVSGLPEATLSYFRVQAYNANGNSDYTPVAAASTGALTPLTVLNAGFENPELPDGGYTPGLPAGWTASVGTVGVLNPTTANALEVPEGSNICYIQAVSSGPSSVKQTLSTTLTAGTTYVLQVDVGRRLEASYGWAGYQVVLKANGQSLATDDSSLLPDRGRFLTSTLTYTATASDAQLGRALEVWLVAKTDASNSTQILFDNVRLATQVTLDAPGSLTARAVSSNTVDLAWADVVSDGGYIIDRSTDGTNWTLNAYSTARNVTSYRVTGLAANSVNYFRVRATNAAQTSLPSSVASFTAGTSSPVSVSNAGFESQVMGDGVWTPGVPTSWQSGGGTGTVGVLNPNSAHTLETPEGSNIAIVCGVSTGGATSLKQVLSSTLTAGTTYVLQVDVGRRLEASYGWAGYQVVLKANGQSLATDDSSLLPDRGRFLTSTLTYTATASDAQLGRALEVWLVAKTDASNSTQILFDNVRIETQTTLATPGVLTARSVSASMVDLSWSDVLGEDKFRIERSSDGATWSEIATTDANVTSYRVASGLTAGGTYAFRVRASNPAGSYSGYSPLAWATTAAALTISNPGFESQVMGDGVWTAGMPTSWQSGGGTGTVGVLNPNSAHTLETPEGSNIAIVCGVSSGPTSLKQILSSTLTAGTTYVLQVDVGRRLEASYGWAGYQVVLKANGVAKATDDSSLLPDRGRFLTSTVTYTASATDAQLGQSLEVWLVAKTDAGNTTQILFDNVRLATVPAPAGLTAQALSPTDVQLSWGDVMGDSGYLIEQSADGTIWSQRGSVIADQTRYILKGLSPGSLNYFRVQASNAAGTSNYSTVASATTLSTGAAVLPGTQVDQAVPAGQLLGVGCSNPGFENPTLADGGYTPGLPPGWTASVGTVGVLNPTTANALEVPEGSNIAYIQAPSTGASYVKQTLSTTLTQGNTYVLQVDVGRRLEASYGWAGYQVVLKANGVTLATDDSSLLPDCGRFLTSTVTYTASATDAQLGQSLEVWLVAKAAGGTCQVLFDNVRVQQWATPPAPATLAARAVSSNLIDLSWQVVTGADGYSIEQSIDQVNWTRIDRVSGATARYRVTGLSSGSLYYYRVQAYTASGNSAYSPTASTTTGQSTPLFVNAWGFENVTLADGSITPGKPLGWTASVGTVGVLNPSTAHTVEVPEGSNICYIQAVSTGESYAMQTLSALPSVGTTYILNVDVGRRLETGYGFAGYKVQLRLKGQSTPVAEESALVPDRGRFLTSTVTYTATAADVQLGQPLEVWLVAKTDASNSTQILFDNVHLETQSVLAAPGMVTLRGLSSDTAEVSWGDVIGEQDYRIETSTDGTNWTEMADAVPADSTSYRLTNLSPQAGYYVRLRARNAAGYSPYSNVAIASTASLQVPVGIWSFDEKTGSTTFGGGNSYHPGTLANGASFVAGRSGNAVSLDGINDYVRVENAADLSPTSQITVAASVYANAWSGTRTIAQKGTGGSQYRLWTEGGVLKFSVAGVGTVIASQSLSSGKWHHVAGTYDGQALRLFVDGMVDPSEMFASGTMATTSDPLYWGASSPSSDFFSGMIDDACVYASALSAQAVCSLAQAAAVTAFQWVYNTIEYQPYAGSLKGGQATRDTKAGNAWDQAALLVQMLQSAGYDARFKYGRIEPSAGDLVQWLGVQDSTAAFTVLQEAGLNPVQFNTQAQPTGTIQFDHAWVEVNLPTDNGMQWCSVDPSWKYKDYRPGLDNLLAGLVPSNLDDSDNLALNRPVTVSGGTGASNAVDGNPSTAWTVTAAAGPQTINVDLGATYNISQVRLNWGSVDYATAYSLQVSSDATNWTTIQSVNSPGDELGNGRYDTLSSFNWVDARYVRLQLTGAGGSQYALKDIAVYGDADLAWGHTVTASSGANPGNITDSDPRTAWTSAAAGNQWASVDLGGTYTLSRVVINWAGDYAYQYDLQASTDNQSWMTLNSEASGNGGVDDWTNLGQAARWVRVLCKVPRPVEVPLLPPNDYSMADLHVYSATPTDRLPAEVYEGKVAAYLAANLPGTSLADVPYDGPIIAKQFTAMPAMPYTVLSGAASADSIPALNTHRIRVTLAQELATNHSASASSSQTGYAAARVTDGNLQTDWRSATAGAQWVYVDLGSSQAVNRVTVTWDDNLFATAYQLQVSNDAATWITLQSITNGQGGPWTFAGLSATARYVRISCTAPAPNQSCYSIKQIEVHRTFLQQTLSVPDVGLKSVTVKYTPSGSLLTPALALDGTVVATSTQSYSDGDSVNWLLDRIGANADETSFASGNNVYQFTRSVGQPLAIGIGAQQISDLSLAQSQSALNQKALDVASGTATPYQYQEKLLAVAALQYFHDVEQQFGNLAGLSHTRYVPWKVDLGIMTGGRDGVIDSHPIIESHPDLTNPYFYSKTSTDNPGLNNFFVPLATTGDSATIQQAIQQLSAREMSTEESWVLEKMLNTSAVSTMKGLDWARKNRKDIYILTQENGSTVFTKEGSDAAKATLTDWSIFGLTTDQLNQVKADVASGYTVTLPTSQVVLDNWTGAVWIKEKANVEYDEYGYMIMGGTNSDYASYGGFGGGAPVGKYNYDTNVAGGTRLGDPVNVYNGNMAHDETDIALPNIGLPLNFARHYDSLSGTDVGLGVGWSHSYSDSILDESATKNTITWTTSQGLRHVFKTANGITNPDDLFGTFSVVSNQPYKYQYVEKTGLTYQFDSSGRLYCIVDRNGNGLACSYNGSNQLSYVADVIDSSRRLTFAYNANGKISSVTDFTGRQWTFGYLSMTDPNNGPTRYYLSQLTSPSDAQTQSLGVQYAYQSGGLLHGLMTSVTDPTGTTSFAYYPNRKAFSVTDGEGQTEYFSYDLYHFRTQHNDTLGRPTIEQYNVNGLTETTIHADRTRLTQAWSGHLLQSSTDELGRTETFKYFAGTGNVQEHTAKDGGLRSYTYDPAYNGISQITEPGGRITSYHYDSHGNVDRIEDALHNVTTMTYTSRGLLDTETSPLGNVPSPDGDYAIHYTYDPNGSGQVWTQRDALTVSPSRPVIENVYNSRGDLLTQTDAASNTTTHSYDLLGHELSVTGADPDGSSGPLLSPVTSYTYQNGQRVSMTDARGSTTQYLYDHLGRHTGIVNADNTVRTSLYDAAGNLVASSDELGRVTRYVYDARNRRVQTLYPDGTSDRVRYDGGGRAVAAINALGQVSSSAYDAGDRLVRSTDAVGTTLDRTYDSVGQLASETKYSLQPTLGSVSSLATTDSIVGTVDWNGDHVTDLICRNASGNIYIYQNGSIVILGQTSSDWMVAATGDFDGDGTNDIVWQNKAARLLTLWLNDTMGTSLPFSLNGDWRVVGALRIDGDNKDSLVFQNSYSAGVQIDTLSSDKSRLIPIMGVTMGGNLAGTGDFNGDGIQDVLWRNPSSGKTGLWLMSSTGVSAQVPLPSLAGSGWQAVGTGDFNQDGKADCLWRNTETGENVLWLLDGTSKVTTVSLPAERNANWKALAVGEFGSDATADVLWQSTDGTNQTRTWLMKASAYDQRTQTSYTRDLVGRVTQTCATDSSGKALLGSTADYNANGNVTVQTQYDVQTPASLPADLRNLTNPYKRDTRFEYDVRGRTTVSRQSVRSVTAITYSGTTATATATAHGYATGDTLVITGATPSIYNGVYTITVTDADHFTYTLASTPASNATGSTIWAQASLSTAAYDALGNVTSQSDAKGNTTRYEYDALNRQIVTRQSVRSVTTITYSGTTATATATAHGYATGDTLVITGATPTVYNGSYVITVTDANHFTYTLASTPASNASGTLWAQASLITAGYDAVGNLTSQSDAKGRTTVTAYDGMNRPTVVRQAARSLSSITYSGTTATATSVAHGYVTGDSLLISGASPSIYNGSYVITVTDANHFTYTLASTPASNASGTLWAQASLSTTGYDAVGNVTSQSDGVGNTTRYDYDTLNRKVKVTNAFGNTAITYYNAAGQVVFEQDALGRFSLTGYDAAGRKVVEQQPDPDGVGPLRPATTRYEYDASGNLQKITDALGHSTVQEYDALQRPTVTRQAAQTITSITHSGTIATATCSAHGYSTGDSLVISGASDPLYNGTVTIAVTDANHFTYSVTSAPSGDVNGPIWAQASLTSTTYDPRGNVKSQTDAWGHATVQEYDTQNRPTVTRQAARSLSSITYSGTTATATATAHGYATGDTLVITGATPAVYNGSYVITVTDADHFTYTLASTPASNASGTLWAQASLITAAYDAVGNLTSQSDAKGRTTVTAYDGMNRPTVVRQAARTLSSITYSGTTATATSIAHGYVTGDRLLISGASPSVYNGVYVVTVTNADHFTYTLASTPASNASGTLWAQSSLSTTGYDANGNVFATTNVASGVTSRTEFDSADRPIVARQAACAVSSITYSGTTATATATAHGYATGDTLVITGATPTVYNGSYVITVTDANHFTYTLTSTPSSNASGTLWAQASLSTTSYDANGNVKTQSDALGHVTVQEYDALNRPTVTRQAARSIGSITYSGTTATVTATAHGYASGDTVAITGATPAVYNGSYVITVTDANHFTYTLASTPSSNASGTLWAQGTLNTIAYDAVGNVKSQTDALGNTTSYEYDALNHKTKEILADPDGLLLPKTAPVTQYAYDAAGNLLSVTDPSLNTTAYTYDALDRRRTESNALSYANAVTYDAAGNVRTTTDRNGRTTRFIYDTANRKTAEQWLDGAGAVIRTVSYSYDSQGRLTKVSDPDATYSYTYDNLDRPLTIDTNGTPSLPRTILTFAYDAKGNRSTLSSSVNGTADLTNSFLYDALNRLTQITQSGTGVVAKRANFAYDADGRLSQIRRYSDLAGTTAVAQTAWVYDTADRLRSLTHSRSGTTLAGYSWTYDAAGRITGRVAPDGAASYVYDVNGQLLSTDNSTLADESFSYDANGNRTMSGYATGTDNRLGDDGTYTYLYDNEGNRTRRTTKSSGAVVDYTWDYRNRLTDLKFKTSATGTITQQVHYVYDATDHRIAKQVDTNGDSVYETTERYVYDGNDLLLVVNGSNAVIGRQFVGAGQVLAEESGGQARWLLADQASSTRDVINSSGTVLDHLVFDSYGKLVSQTNSSYAPRYGYGGMQSDAESGLGYAWHRYYDAAVGRFLSVDPLSFAAGDTNLYRYVQNNPLSGTDPTGLCSQTSTSSYYPGSGIYSLDNPSSNYSTGYSDSSLINILLSSGRSQTDPYGFAAAASLRDWRDEQAATYEHLASAVNSSWETRPLREDDAHAYENRGGLGMGDFAAMGWAQQYYRNSGTPAAAVILDKSLAFASVGLYKDSYGGWADGYNLAGAVGGMAFQTAATWGLGLAVKAGIGAVMTRGGMAALELGEGTALARSAGGFSMALQEGQATMRLSGSAVRPLAMASRERMLNTTMATITRSVGLDSTLTMEQQTANFMRASSGLRQMSPNIYNMGGRVRSVNSSVQGGLLPSLEGNIPDAVKWIRKGDRVTFHADGAITYTDWEGNAVRYSSRGYPDYKAAGMVRQEVQFPYRGNYTTDFTTADGLGSLGPRLPENTWHHVEDLTTMQEMNSRLHNRFTHRGGVSIRSGN